MNHLVLLQGDAEGASLGPAGQELACGAEQGTGNPRPEQPGEAAAPILMTSHTATRRFKFTLQGADHELDAQVDFCPSE